MTIASIETIIRLARPTEAAAITNLIMRSKAYWGYDTAFLVACRAGLTISPEYLVTHPAYVAEWNGQPVGFYSLAEEIEGQQVELDFLFIAPEAIGKGVGSQMWQHAVATSHRLGYHLMSIVADPHAEPFYRKMGAITVGAEPSQVQAGRMLPLMHYDLDKSPIRGQR
jgi:GNAT superfamily N-acetyltransferase